MGSPQGRWRDRPCRGLKNWGRGEEFPAGEREDGEGEEEKEKTGWTYSSPIPSPPGDIQGFEAEPNQNLLPLSLSGDRGGEVSGVPSNDQTEVGI